MPTIEQFAVFKQIIEAGSISAGVRGLYISPAGASMQMKKLESELGTTLFERTNRGIEPTDAGRLAYDAAIKMLHLYCDLKSQINKRSCTVHDEIRIGATYGIGGYLFPRILHLKHTDGCPVNFNATIASVDEVCEQLQSGNLRIGLIEAPPKPEHRKHLYCKAFWKDKLVVVASANSPWGERDAISFDELLAQKVIMINRNEGLWRSIEVALTDAGFDPAQIVFDRTINNMTTIKHAVMEGLGVSILPEPVIASERESGRLLAYDLVGVSFERPLSIAKLLDTELNIDEGWFVDQLQNRDLVEKLLSSTPPGPGGRRPCPA